MSKITTHVLDAVLGKPAAGIDIRLDAAQGQTWTNVSTGVTDADGRCRDLIEDAAAASSVESLRNRLLNWYLSTSGVPATNKDPRGLPPSP